MSSLCALAYCCSWMCRQKEKKKADLDYAVTAKSKYYVKEQGY